MCDDTDGVGLVAVDTWEDGEWVVSAHDDRPITRDDVADWTVEGPRRQSVDGETHFCSADVLKLYIALKTKVKALPERIEQKAKIRGNPYEAVRRSIFMDRNAVKIANVDARMEYMFTRPTSPDGTPLQGDEALFFADVGGECGGFSEYIMWRVGWRAKGLGFSRYHDFGFQSDRFHATGTESFEADQAKIGVKGGVKLYGRQEIDEFKRFVSQRTDGGVHFMMAHGSFELRPLIKELTYKQTYLSRLLMGLDAIRVDGHLFCTVFETFTPFSVGLLYLMYRAFEKIALFKPNACRPANSERVLVCKWRREDVQPIRDYLYEVNNRLCALSHDSAQDILEVVPLDVIKNDQVFTEYMTDVNCRLAERQIEGMTALLHFAEDASLTDHRQMKVRSECLRLWNLPDEDPVKDTDELSSPEAAASRLQCPDGAAEPLMLDKVDTLRRHVTRKDQWRVAVSGVPSNCPEDRCVLLGLGGSRVFQYLATHRRWCRLNRLELAANTVLYAEIVAELHGERSQQPESQVLRWGLHIIDASWLGGQDVRSKSIDERHALCKTFAGAINKPSRPDLIPIRCRPLHTLSTVGELLAQLTKRPVRGSVFHDPILQLLSSSGGRQQLFIARGLLLLDGADPRSPLLWSWPRSGDGVLSPPAAIEPPLSVRPREINRRPTVPLDYKTLIEHIGLIPE